LREIGGNASDVNGHWPLLVGEAGYTARTGEMPVAKSRIRGGPRTQRGQGSDGPEESEWRYLAPCFL
jgi:hypothetical protein